ncbi:MAG: FAD-binding oxidoreductase [Proteobacteria bacterium]|nr:FAD-binding oxidoreductase [Pseudomonadota bacterium]
MNARTHAPRGAEITKPNEDREMLRSHWLQEVLAEEGEAAPRLEGEHKADVCIVGGGYTGLWTAIRLKERDPSLEVVILEKDICGGGASGRNGGFVLSWWAKYLSMKKICGAEEAIRLCKASADAVDEIGRFCRENGIDAHYRHDGWLWAATCPAHFGCWDSTIEDLEKHQMHPFRVLSEDETARMAGTPSHLRGVFEETAATVQPARLARGLRRVAASKGVKIFENTPMTRLTRSTPPVVKCPGGRVRAACVVLAINAWSAKFPEMRRAFAVISSDMIVTEPIPDRLERIGWNNGMAISDSQMLVQYYRTTLDGRIAFGKGGVNGVKAFGGNVGNRFEGQSPLAGDVAAGFKELYPALADVGVATSWIGPVDRSKSGLPMFGPLRGRPDILYAVGFSGNGVGPCLVAGKILASLTLGARDEWGASGLVRPLERGFPPEPIRYFGTSLVRAAAIAKDRAEREGRQPGLITRFMAGFAPSGLSPTKGKTAEALGGLENAGPRPP